MKAAPIPLVDARRADSATRRQRVLKALDQLAAAGGGLSVSAVARAARVHHSFTYRHDDLHVAVTDRAARTADEVDSATVSRQSLMAELANAAERNRRQAQRVSQLEKRLSDVLGETVWRESGLGAPVEVDALQRRITTLEQANLDLRDELAERDDELAAARATNRELMSRLNTKT